MSCTQPEHPHCRPGTENNKFRSQRNPATGAVADFGRSSLPRRTSRPAATCVHVNKRIRPIFCSHLHTLSRRVAKSLRFCRSCLPSRTFAARRTSRDAVPPNSAPTLPNHVHPKSRQVAKSFPAERTYRRSCLPSRTFAAKANLARRGHWGIENNLHWQLDVTFGKDQCRLRKGHSDANFSILRRTALALLKNEPTARVGIKNKRLMARCNEDYLSKVLFKIET